MADRVEIDYVFQATSGAAISGASVYVLTRGGDYTNTANRIQVYNGEGEAATVLAQPLTTTASGGVTGWVVPGSYDLRISATGYSTVIQPWEAVKHVNVAELELGGAYDRSQGQAGIVAPSAAYFGNGLRQLVANQAFFARVYPSRDMAITRISFSVTTAAGSDDAVDVGIFDINGNRLASSGAVTGKLNTLGVKTVLLTSVPSLLSGTSYYVAISCGVVGTTAATIAGVDTTGNRHRLFGSTAGVMEATDMITAHPLPNPVAYDLTSAHSAYPILALGTTPIETLLNGAHDAVIATITVDSTTDFPTAGTIQIDAEKITYTSKTATTFTGATRGAAGTTAAAHDDDTGVRLA